MGFVVRILALELVLFLSISALQNYSTNVPYSFCQVPPTLLNFNKWRSFLFVCEVQLRYIRIQKNQYRLKHNYRRAPVSTDSLSVVTEAWKNRNKQFVSFKTRAERERTVTWWNPASQTWPVLDSSSFAPALTLPRRTCHHSATRVLGIHISCRVIGVFMFRKPLIY
jgi:hypothetical protein